MLWDFKQIGVASKLLKAKFLGLKGRSTKEAF